MVSFWDKNTMKKCSMSNTPFHLGWWAVGFWLTLAYNSQVNPHPAMFPQIM